MRRYLDSDVALADVDERLRREWAGFEPSEVRRRLIADSPFRADRVQRLQLRPFDMRYAYIDKMAGLWNRPRPQLIDAARVASDFLLVRRRAPRALDGATFLFSRCLVDQHAMHRHAYVIPFWLTAEGATDDGGEPERLFETPEELAKERWRPNLSESAMQYLNKLGIGDAGTDQDSASLLWLHLLAIGFSPLYVEENGEALRSDWPRVPLPNSEEGLRTSAVLGRTVAALLHLDSPVAGVDRAPLKAHQQFLAGIEAVGGGTLNPRAGDLSLTSGWGIPQPGLVMPGAGRFDERPRTDAEATGLTAEQCDLLGTQVLDIYLNDSARWRNVPAAAWDYKIGGFQVLRKWLSYRDRRVLGRDLTTAEARAFTHITRRLTSLVLLGPKLDANYIGVTESRQQEQLFPGA